eukprot:4327366-Pyramimonas_sp.AAC.1
MSQKRYSDGWPDPNTFVTPGKMWSMCSGSTWDSNHRVHIERRAWPGWRPVQPLVSQDGARSLPGLVIPEDALH